MEDETEGHSLPQGESAASHQPEDTSSTPTDGENESKSRPQSGLGISQIELAAIELYAEILLSRAHFLFFTAVGKNLALDAEKLEQGKAALEKAEKLCMSGDYPVGNSLMAKCWYLRGFLADIDGDLDNAVACFTEAARTDDKFGKFQRVQWVLHHQEDAALMPNAWNSEGSPYGGASNANGGRSSISVEDMKRLAHASLESNQSWRSSVLWNKLLEEVQDVQDQSPPDLPSSPPLAAHQSLGSDRLDFDAILANLGSTPPRRHESPEWEGIVHTIQTRTERNPVVALLDGKRAQAIQAHMAQKRTGVTAKDSAPSPSMLPPRPLNEEALLSDTPSISELDTTFTALPVDSSISPLKLSINTHASRRSSVSTKMGSPSSPSPLRKASLIGDLDDETDHNTAE
jgi:tetratricopeptide (TPR) repeat protein